jgi:hypothetical protein
LRHPFVEFSCKAGWGRGMESSNSLASENMGAVSHQCY